MVLRQQRTTEVAPLDRLAEFVDRLRWGRIPAEVQARARLAFRDTLGTIIGGASTPAGKIADATAKVRGGLGPIQAFATAVKASALDFDDGHYLGGAIHPGSVVVSALLVAALETDAELHDVLTAQVAGYEIALRAAHLLWPRHELNRYHCTGTAATLGAAAAVAKLRGHDADMIARSIAIAWAHAPMSTFQLPMVKESIGWSAASGFFAADLAAGGFMAMAAASNSAITATFRPTPFDEPGAMDDPFVSSLGYVYESGKTYFKPFAACRYTHTAARSLQELQSELAIGADDITRIDVYTHRAAMNLTDVRPASLDHAQYSFPFVLATVAITGYAGSGQVNHDSLFDTDRLAFAKKVFVHHDEAFDSHYPTHYGSRIVVTTTLNIAVERIRLVSPGDLADPLSRDELTNKFFLLVETVLGSDSQAIATRLIENNEIVGAPELRALIEAVLQV
jgi:2-methylcitrate dehydratase PrpD